MVLSRPSDKQLCIGWYGRVVFLCTPREGPCLESVTSRGSCIWELNCPAVPTYVFHCLYIGVVSMAGYARQEKVRFGDNMQRPMALASQLCFQIQAPGPALLATDLLQGEVAISQEAPQLSPAVLQLLQEILFRRKREEALVQELQLRMKREETLVQDLKAKMKTSIDLVLELNAGKKMERNLCQNIGAYRLREVEFLKDLDSRKKREEEILRDCNNLESERDEWLCLCKSALASIKELEDEIQGKEKKHRKLETEMKARFALAAEKSQHEKVILMHKDAEIGALQSQLAEMEKEKQKHWDEKVEMNKMSKEFVFYINSMQLFLIKHVAALTANVLEYQKILRSPDKPNPSQELGNNQGEEARSCQQTAPCTDEQENAEGQGMPSLESSAENLVKEIDCANSAMTQVVEEWKEAVHEKCCEVPAKLERTSDTEMDSTQSFEICAGPSVDALKPHKKMKTMKDVLQEDALTVFSPVVNRRRLLDVILGKHRSSAKISEGFKAKIVAGDFPRVHSYK